MIISQGKKRKRGSSDLSLSSQKVFFILSVKIGRLNALKHRISCFSVIIYSVWRAFSTENSIDQQV